MGSYFRDYYSPKASERPTVGDTKFSVVNMDHMGWLKCDGRALPVATYNILFQAIGYKFGGSGTTFNLPDMQGRVPGGIGTGTGLTARILGDTTGTETHTLTIAEMPAHTHGSANVTGNTNGSGVTTTAGSHNHGGSTSGLIGGTNIVNSLENVYNSLTPLNAVVNAGEGTHDHSISTDGAHTHSIGNTGGGAAHNNMQPTLFIGNLFIYSGKQSFTAGSYPYTSSYPAAIGDILL